MHSVDTHELCAALAHAASPMRMLRTLRRILTSTVTLICIAPAAWAIPTLGLSPGFNQGSINLSRPASMGAFTADYDFTLATAAAAVYNTGRFNLADSPSGAIRINQFSARLFLRPGDAPGDTAIATGIDTDVLGYMISNDFFVAALAPGNYRLELSGIDENSGYDGVFRIAPPAPLRAAAQVPEPQSSALLLLALGLLLAARRQAGARQSPTDALLLARGMHCRCTIVTRPLSNLAVIEPIPAFAVPTHDRRLASHQTSCFA